MLPYHTQPDVHSYHPLLLYPSLLGYVSLGKVERYGGVVQGKNRFNGVGHDRVG